MNVSRKGMVISALPSLLTIGVFYSLVIHMRYSLGGWPATIGDNGFPPALIAHGDWVFRIFAAFVVTLFILPVAALLCAVVERWRRFLVYLAAYTLFYGLFWVCVLLAPERFLHWWWD